MTTADKGTTTHPYSHTQYARWTWVPIIIGSLLALLGALYAGTGQNSMAVAGIVLLATLVLGASFYCLRVTVNGRRVAVKFGMGLFQTSISLRDVVACEMVRNTPWMGWGIRWICGGWLYNIEGLDAVELTMKNAKKIRIGTNEPERLLAAIESASA